ncbi:MAG: TonB family protein [Candidatus Omnitrophota bacterium]
MKKALSIGLLLIFNFMSLPLAGYALDESGGEIKLVVGEVTIMPVNNPTRIVIGNPDIADVSDVAKNEMTIVPKAPGTTNMVLWDNFGEQSYEVRVIAENMDAVKRRIDILIGRLNLPQVYTQIAEDEGKVLLLGRVKAPADRERIATALGPLKDKTTDLIVVKEEEAVVNIDVQVLELSKDATSTLGFTWPGAITLTDVSAATTTATTGLEKVFRVSQFTRTAFNVTLDALVQEGKVNILSRPRLSCQSGKEAELLVGGEKPIFTTTVAATTGASGTSIEYKEYGIKLKIKPTVTDDKKVKLALNVEVSEVGTVDTIGTTSTGEVTAKAYPLTKRNASTELLLNDGQTMAIGGLMKQKTEEAVRKTAWAGDLPIVGALFRQKTTKVGGGIGERGNTELFITLTPTVSSEEKKAPEVKKEITPKISSSGASDISGNTLGPKALYATIIQKRILENMIYPSLAKEAGFQGELKLSLLLSYRGELLEARLKESSGYKILDDQAVNVAKGIATYPPFPSSIEQKELWIDVPIAYQLD